MNLRVVYQLKLITRTYGLRTMVKGGKQRMERKGWANTS